MNNQQLWALADLMARVIVTLICVGLITLVYKTIDSDVPASMWLWTCLGSSAYTMIFAKSSPPKDFL